MGRPTQDGLVKMRGLGKTKDEVPFENGNKMGNLGIRPKAMNAIPILVYSGVGM